MKLCVLTCCSFTLPIFFPFTLAGARSHTHTDESRRTGREERVEIEVEEGSASGSNTAPRHENAADTSPRTSQDDSTKNGAAGRAHRESVDEIEIELVSGSSFGNSPNSDLNPFTCSSCWNAESDSISAGEASSES